MRELSNPTPELATQIMAEVEFPDRLVGYKMNPMSGYEQTSIYSLEEAVPFLYMDSLGQLLAKGNGGSMGYLDLPKLQQFVANALGDQELALAIQEEMDAAESYRDQIGPIRELIINRLEQCQEVLALSTEDNIQE